jgi:hypothetical protein
MNGSSTIHIFITTKRHSQLRNTEVEMFVFAETSVPELHAVVSTVQTLITIATETAEIVAMIPWRWRYMELF